MYTAKTILVPVDFSNTSRAAMSVALQMADRSGGRIIFLHVDKVLKRDMHEVLSREQPSGVLTTEIAQCEDGVRDAIEGELERSAQAGQPLRRTPHDIRICSGDWLHVALQIIEDEKVNLVVAATHGGEKTGLLGMLQGSVTEKLVHLATCSVFVVKAEGFPYLTD